MNFNIVKKAKRAIDDGGISLLLKRGVNFSYRKISPILPQIYREYNGVMVPSHKFLGGFVPFVDTQHKPNYEEGIVNSLEENVQEGDRVTILGGGNGVSAVKASQLSGESGNVKVYEASKEQISCTRKTFKKNNIENVELNHGLVGSKVNAWGSTEGARKISPHELEACDVLEMDIEGSELEVLENLEIKPRILIVETHGSLGSPTEVVKEKIENLNYEIVEIDLAEDIEFAMENDIKVITAKLEENQ